MAEEKLMTIATYTYSLRAYLTRQRLESEGVECYLTNENFTYGIHANLEDGIELKVPEHEYKKAMEVLEQIKDEYGADQIRDKEVVVRKILVPVDFTEQSRNACHFAIGLADYFHAEVKLLHSFYIPSIEAMPMGESSLFPGTLDEHLHDIEFAAKKRMHELMNSLNEWKSREKLLNSRLSHILSKGYAEDEILEIYKVYQPDIIVMGTSGSDEKTTDLYGSITAEVVESVKVPLLAIPRNSLYQGIDSLKNIMYATNFDDSDFRAIHKLMYLISPFKMKLSCLHIRSGNKDPWDNIKMDALREHLNKQYIGKELEIDVIESDDILSGFDKYIKDKNIGIVAMTTHKKGFFARLFSTSLTKQMLFHSKTPLLIFH
ncbi:MAG: universal stress protein [Bacteroidia bacterium]|nr:universal stress protein [Bacteroidia bacterium]